MSGANPTIASYNASAVKIYNAMCGLVRFENKTILFYYEKGSSLLQRWRCSCKFKSRRIGSWYERTYMYVCMHANLNKK
jgi:hypothetical protein